MRQQPGQSCPVPSPYREGSADSGAPTALTYAQWCAALRIILQT